MQVLIAAATATEIAPLRAWLSENWSCAAADAFEKGAFRIRLITTGVGLLEATFSLTRACAAGAPELLVLAGIAGAFDKGLEPGSLVVVAEDTVGDLGAEDGPAFLTLPDIGLAEKGDTWIPAEIPLVSTFAPLPRVKGITVNTVTGSRATEEIRMALFDAAVESMEGAAAHRVANAFGIPLLHLRAISNHTGLRDRGSRKIKEAVSALNAALIAWLGEIEIGG